MFSQEIEKWHVFDLIQTSDHRCIIFDLVPLYLSDAILGPWHIKPGKYRERCRNCSHNHLKQLACSRKKNPVWLPRDLMVMGKAVRKSLNHAKVLNNLNIWETYNSEKRTKMLLENLSVELGENSVKNLKD